MRLTLATLTVLALAGCGDSSTSTETTAPTNGTNTATPCAGDTALCDTAPVGPTYMDPVAVGFEIIGVLYEDGSLHALNFDGGEPQDPLVVLKFADEAYFSADSEATQAGHFCEIAATLVATPQPFNTPAFDAFNNQTLNWSYETNLILEWEFQDTACAGKLDPSVYGDFGELLTEQFQNMHFGFGFGAMTDRLWGNDGPDDPANADFVDEIFGVYISVNDSAGHWGGCDWDYGFLYEVDDLDQTVEDPDNPGFLKAVTIGAMGTGPLPKGYLRTGASWYQDFPLMSQSSTAPWDFSHMANEPVAGSPTCGDW